MVVHIAPLALLVFLATANVSGLWELTIVSDQGTFHPTIDLKQDGEKLTGTYKGTFGESKLEGSIKEKKIEWKTTVNAQGQAVEFTYRGMVESASEMKGKVDFAEFGSAEWTAKKKQKE